uniref:Uncharacterized protein n=1 Tax=Anguilla anguilla TaxID=7936 RepID=A0A0E9RMS5_ANGAN
MLLMSTNEAVVRCKQMFKNCIVLNVTFLSCISMV